MSLEDKLISAVIGLGAGLAGAYLKQPLVNYALSSKLKSEYEYEQKKRLRQLIGTYYGRFVESAEKLNHRLLNLQENQDNFWLQVNGQFHRADYYFSTTIYRFLSLLYLINKFEVEALYIDGRIAEKRDLEFVKFAKILEYVLADTTLFDGLAYDNNTAHDHFFRGHLVVASETMEEDGTFVKMGLFLDKLKKRKYPQLLPILAYFDGLAKNEPRFRWDRLVAFHLLLICFLNSFGYDMQKTDEAELARISGSIRNPNVKMNLVKIIGKLGLQNNKSARILLKHLKCES